VGIAGELLGGDAVLLVPGEDRVLRPPGGAAEPIGFDERERSVAAWVHGHGEPAGRGTGTLPSGRWTFAPLLAASGPVGVLGVTSSGSGRAAADRLRMMRACADVIALALERARLAHEAEAARVAVEGERTRSALLASVSHDLRTPLAVIQGAVTSLAARATGRGDAAETELLATAAEESERLNRLVGDLLEITRLESGVRLEKDWQSVEELVGAAVARAFRGEQERPLRVQVPRDLPLVAVDGVLLTQALIHLLENARAHTPAGTPVELEARIAGEWLELEVADRGPGLAAEDLDRIFEKFYRVGKVRTPVGASPGAVPSARPTTPPLPDAPVGPPGSGLGLAICRAIVEAHGGSIRAEARPGGGALFRIRVPRGGEAPTVPEAPPEPSKPGEGGTAMGSTG
jgi:two-component system sensor histidine kinase KdpD